MSLKPIARELRLMASEGTSGYVLAVVRPPVDGNEHAFLRQPSEDILPAEEGSFSDGSQFFAYHQAHFNSFGVYSQSKEAKEERLTRFAEQLVEGVTGLEFTGRILPLSDELAEKILGIQSRRASPVISLAEQAGKTPQ